MRWAGLKSGRSVVAMTTLALLVGCNAISGVGDIGIGQQTVPLPSDPTSSDGSTNIDGEPTPGDDSSTGEQQGEDASTITADDGGADDGSVSDDAGPVIVDPDSGTSGDAAAPTKRVFITSASSSGSLGGLDGADSKCAAAANNGNLGGTWVAWLSTSTVNAIDRIAFDGPYVLLDGRPVVANKAQLSSGHLTNAITVTELGGPPENYGVWTGSNSAGTLRCAKGSCTCNDWTTGGFVIAGSNGTASATDGKWTADVGIDGSMSSTWACGPFVGRLYCFER